MKLWILFRLIISSDPYGFLQKKISKYSSSIIEKIYYSNLSLSFGEFLKKLLKRHSKSLTKWTNYSQTINSNQNKQDSRTTNFVKFLNSYKPSAILDIGANKGAFTKLALENGVQKAIAADLDGNSLEELRQEIIAKRLQIWIVKLNLMNYPISPGYYKSYLSAHDRFHSDCVICFAVVHHLCYFGPYTFSEFAEKLSIFTDKIILVEFIPYDDIHLTGPLYKGRDRSWYTLDNFIEAMKKFFPGDHEIYESTPNPRKLLKFVK